MAKNKAYKAKTQGAMKCPECGHSIAYKLVVDGKKCMQCKGCKMIWQMDKEEASRKYEVEEIDECLIVTFKE